MASDEDGDVAMECDGEKGKEEAEPTSEAEAPKAPERPLAEVVAEAEAAKEAGNAALKATDMVGAAAKYAEGIVLTEPLLDKAGTSEAEEGLKQKARTLYLALRLNSAQASLKLSQWADAAEHAERVLALDADNCKALYRRGLASAQLESESRLEQARADFARLAQLEPANKEAREQLQKVREKIKLVKQRERERFAGALNSGLYEEERRKAERLRMRYDEEVARRKEAGESEISFEDWHKKEKEREKKDKEKAKEEEEKANKEKENDLAEARWYVENERRKEAGEEEITLADYIAEQKNSKRGVSEVVRADEVELDDEEKKLLQEASKKGYYHGRLNTVLSSAAPTPQQIARNAETAPGIEDPLSPKTRGASEWNQAGTWEETNTSAWVKGRIQSELEAARVASPRVLLKSGEAHSVTAKVTRVKTLTGEAQIVMVRGKRKHGYDYNAELSFSLTFRPTDAADGDDKASKSETYSGYLNLPELNDSTAPEDLRIDVSWKGSAPPERIQPTAREWVEELKRDVRQKVQAFVEQYAEQ